MFFAYKIRNELTKAGWYRYVNMMYYLMPEQDQMSLNAVVVEQLNVAGRELTPEQILMKV